jgi:predicted hydrocarbon binding protein
VSIVEINKTFHSSDIIFSSEGFGLLRKTLYENIGEKRAKILLLQFGYKLGREKALELKQYYSDKKELIRWAPLTHINLGHVSKVETNGSSILNENGEIIFIDSIGKWFDSFEADLHTHYHGESNTCACHTLSGYASGYLSEIYEIDIYVVEQSCKAMGYPHCTFEVNTKKQWLQINPLILNEFDHQTVAEELEITYDKLLSQKQLLDKVTNYHSQLTECVAKKNSLHHVLSTAYNILNIPIIIKQTNDKTIALKGIDESNYTNLLKQAPKPVTISKHNETIFEKLGGMYKMTTPIYLDNRVFATCSFLYENAQSLDENDYLFLERLSITCALCFLKEKISFETTERLKISILDRLIYMKHESQDDLKTHFHLLTDKIEEPYASLVIRCNHKKDTYLPIDYYDQLLQFSQIFKLHYLNALFSISTQDIYVLLSISTHQDIEEPLLKILNQLQKNNPDLHYTIGVSHHFTQLELFSEHLKQAKQAVSLPRNKSISYYSELGLLGDFLNNIDTETLKQTASTQLKDLLIPEPKMQELLYTLYIYLINGKRLEKTMQALNLSMGGIQYRIRKIEETIQINLKDSYTTAYLLLLIEALIIMKEIEF